MKQKLTFSSFLLLCFISLPTSISANQSNDSLSVAAYKKAKSTVDSCNFYFDRDLEKYNFFAKQFDSVDFRQLIDSNFRETISERTDFLRRNFKYKEAISILSEAITIAIKKKDTSSQALFHKSISSHYYHLGYLDSTSLHLDKAYTLYQYLKEESEMGIIAIRKSRVAYDQGAYQNAIKFSFEALELYKASGNKSKMAISYLQLGNTYLYLSNHLAAKKYFELASILFKITGNEFGYAEAVSNVGLVEINTGDYRKGLNKQFASLNYYLSEGYARDAGVVSNYIVNAYLGLQKYDSSIYYNELAKEQFEKSNYQAGYCESYLNEAKVFYLKREYQKSLESALKAHKIAAENSYNILVKESNLELYRIYKKLNKQSKSFTHLEQYVKMRDSLKFDPYVLQSEVLKYQLAAEEAQLYREIAEERAQLEFEEGEKTEQKLFNTIVIAIVILILLLVAIYYLLKNRILNKNLNRQRSLLSEDLKVKESLLSEVHHRVKNNLQVINSILSLQNNYISDESLKSIIEECKSRIYSMSLIHENLYRKQDFTEPLFQSYIEDILSRLIKSYGTGQNKVQYSLDIDPVKLSLDESIPCGLIINEIVTNSLKYAFPDGKGGNIRVELKQIKNEIQLTVSDDGVGLKEGKLLQASDSFGILLIETLASQLGDDLSINTLNGFTYVIKWKKQSDLLQID